MSGFVCDKFSSNNLPQLQQKRKVIKCQFQLKGLFQRLWHENEIQYFAMKVSQQVHV